MRKVDPTKPLMAVAVAWLFMGSSSLASGSSSSNVSPRFRHFKEPDMPGTAYGAVPNAFLAIVNDPLLSRQMGGFGSFGNLQGGGGWVPLSGSGGFPGLSWGQQPASPMGSNTGTSQPCITGAPQGGGTAAPTPSGAKPESAAPAPAAAANSSTPVTSGLAIDPKCNYCNVRPTSGGANTYCQYASSTSPAPSCGKVLKFALTDDEKKAAVDLHNAYRRNMAKGKEPRVPKTAANMMELVWSEELARGAQLWANQCQFSHDHVANCKYNWIGQNLYQSGSFGMTASTAGASWKEAVDAWYSEVSLFNGQTDSFGFSASTGHFTQIVWAKTSEVGCGYVAYSNPNMGGNAKYYVCNYGEGGNFAGNPLFITGPPCSKCPSGTTCKDGLCSKAAPAIL